MGDPHSREQIVVAGDVTIDWIGVRTPASDDDSVAHNWRLKDGVPMFSRLGGAYLLANLIKAACGKEFDIAGPDEPTEPIQNVPPLQVIHSMVTVSNFSGSSDPTKRLYRVESFNGFAGPKTGSPAPK